MKFLFTRILLVFSFFLIIFLKGQDFPALEKKSYTELRKQYEEMPENDQRAIPFIWVYLKKAKKENNFKKIYQGYQDAAFYTKEKTVKLKYADSCVNYALKSNEDELISNAYLEKGVIYYFFYKKYQPALNEYLKAYEYSNKIKDDFLKYRIIYHLGVVKSYLGYYNDALKLFEESKSHFKSLANANIHPNLVYNNQKGYLNSLHQQIICYRQLGNYRKSDSLIQVGLSSLPTSREYSLERSYFIKCLGISEFKKRKYPEAIAHLRLALPEIKKINDFNWTSVIYYYIGQSYEKVGKEDLAISYFVKVDSTFQKEKFIVPELRSNYESLINYYNKIKDPEKELHYTKQLLNVDNMINKDFQYLSDKIHKEYDTKALLEKQQQLENKNSVGSISLKIAIVLIFIMAITIYYRNKKEKMIQCKYAELEKRIIEHEKLLTTTTSAPCTVKENRIEVPDMVLNDILQKLDDFERKKEFTKKGLTQQELAKIFSTNTAYLSQIINEYKGKKFNSYLNELRICYITDLLYHNPKFLDYTIEALSKECGITSRHHFSELFQEINDIRPTDFIKKRKIEMGKSSK
ncbi:AraC family transcriptional regulator [Weeksellaceae bacterium A-14]